MRQAQSTDKESSVQLQAAFSLTEMLVVVSIMALLAMLAFPALDKGREWARSTKCMSNLHQFGLGIPLYASDHDGVMYPVSVPGNGDWFWLGDDRTIGSEPFSNYTGAPFAQYVGYPLGVPQLSRNGGSGYLLYCPSISAKYPGTSDVKNIWGQLPNGCLGYAFNGSLFLRTPARLSNFGGDLSRKIVMADGTGVSVMQLTYNYPFAPGAARHNNHINALFMDGHVGALTLDEVSRDGTGEKPFADLISRE